MQDPRTSPHERAGLDAAPELPKSGVYGIFADKIGLVPNVRFKDNALQAAACGLLAVLGAAFGLVFGKGVTGLLTGLLLGLVAGLFLSGGVLLVVGLLRR